MSISSLSPPPPFRSFVSVLLFPLALFFQYFLGGHGEHKTGKPHYDTRRPHVAVECWTGTGLGHINSSRHDPAGSACCRINITIASTHQHQSRSPSSGR